MTYSSSAGLDPYWANSPILKTRTAAPVLEDEHTIFQLNLIVSYVRLRSFEEPVDEVAPGFEGLAGKGVEIGWKIWAVVDTEGKDMLLNNESEGDLVSTFRFTSRLQESGTYYKEKTYFRIALLKAN
jgi:hypothetical protein